LAGTSDGRYRNATRVLVYLGEEENGSQLLEGCVPLLLFAKARMEAAGVEKDIFELSRWEKTKYFIPTHSAPIRALGAIQHRVWFQRVWIIQELLLGKAATVICGRWEIPWADFEAAFRFVDTLRIADVAIGPIPDLVNLNAARLRQSHNQWMEDPHPKALCSLLSTHRLAKATNPLDHIYALLSLAEEINEVDIDYSKQVEEVFIAAAKTILRRSTNLNFLNAAGQGFNTDVEHSQTSLPSWVPDWRTDMETYPMIDETSSYAATVNSKAGSIFFEDNKLYLAGYEIDTVVETSCCCNPCPCVPGDNFKSFHNMITTLVEWADFCEPYLGNVQTSTAQGQVNLFWQLLIAEKTDWTFAQQKSMVETTELAMDWMRVARRLLPRKHVTSSVYWLLRMPELIFGLVILQLGLPRSWERGSFYERKLGKSIGRRMFMTEKGHFGLAPKATQPSDRVCLIRGGSTPYILRRTANSNEYYLMGECSLHGHMAGEAWSLEKCYPISVI
jgi:hypothetical protein